MLSKLHLLPGLSLCCLLLVALIPATDELHAMDGEAGLLEEDVTSNDLIEQIDGLEAEYGAYQPKLQQLLFRLGKHRQEQGNHIKALSVFERALHVSKVNTGLHNTGQLPIVETMLESYSSLNDWKGLGDRLHYMLWLHRRNFNNEDDRLLAMIERVGRWYMKAYYLHKGGEALSFMVKADDLFDELVDVLSTYYGENSSKMIGALHARATINYHIANDVSDVFTTSHRDIRQAMIPNKRATPYMNEVAVRDYYFDQSFYKGRRALQNAIDIYASELPGSAARYAEALANQGDFYLSLNRKWNAMKNYAKAYEVLLEYKVDENVIQDIFGEPKLVEPFSVAGQELDQPGSLRYVDALFDVPGNGWPRDIRITSTHPGDSKELMTRGKHAVAASRYRPRFEAGKPVNTSNVYLRYVFR